MFKKKGKKLNEQEKKPKKEKKAKAKKESNNKKTEEKKKDKLKRIDVGSALPFSFDKEKKLFVDNDGNYNWNKFVWF